MALLAKFSASAEGFSWNFVTAIGLKKNRMIAKKVSRFVHLFRHNIGIGQTEKRTRDKTSSGDADKPARRT